MGSCSSFHPSISAHPRHVLTYLTLVARLVLRGKSRDFTGPNLSQAMLWPFGDGPLCTLLPHRDSHAPLGVPSQLVEGFCSGGQREFHDSWPPTGHLPRGALSPSPTLTPPFSCGCPVETQGTYLAVDTNLTCGFTGRSSGRHGNHGWLCPPASMFHVLLRALMQAHCSDPPSAWLHAVLLGEQAPPVLSLHHCPG